MANAGAGPGGADGCPPMPWGTGSPAWAEAAVPEAATPWVCRAPQWRVPR